jgi:hypothetical protein
MKTIIIDGIEYNLTPKVLFKKGDWIVFNGLTLYIKEVVKGYYRTISRGGIPNSYDWNIDNIARLWTIQDAKDGDVLIDKSNNRESPFIFKKTKHSDIKTDCLNPLTVLGYCGIGGAGFTKSEGWGDTANCTYYPATKEQRDTLEKAMAAAGYTFDFEKKELKKIEQKPADLKTKAGNWYVCDMEVMNENMVTAFHRGEIYYCPKDGYLDVGGALFEVGCLDVFRLATEKEIPQPKQE